MDKKFENTLKIHSKVSYFLCILSSSRPRKRNPAQHSVLPVQLCRGKDLSLYTSVYLSRIQSRIIDIIDSEASEGIHGSPHQALKTHDVT